MTYRALCLLLVLFSAGCVEFDPGGVAPDEGDAQTGLDGRCPYVPMTCPNRVVSADPLTSRVFETESSAGEDGLQLQARADTRIQVSTVGSNMDTVMAVFSETCDGPMIACSDDFVGTRQSQVELDVADGETVVVVVAKMSGGVYVLNVDEL